MQNILVTGGAGYIGSHMVKMLQSNNYNVIVIDDLSKGHKEYINCELYQTDIASDEVDIIIKKYNFDAVMHFASSIEVSESVKDPQKYFFNNYEKSKILIDKVKNSNIKKFIFSSTAAIFGSPIYTPIDEKHPKNPINPYGKSKLMVEEYLQSTELDYGCFRYFNAAGADGKIGENHEPETHLIPLILKASINNKPIHIYGNDYETKDGTCIRDYIHVYDICHAHMQFLTSNSKNRFFNLGNGKGYSIMEVIKTTEKIIGKKILTTIDKRRQGDPSILIANGNLAKDQLDWAPTHNLESIIKSAYNWEITKTSKI